MGRRRRTKTLFEESLQLNQLTYNQYLLRLTELACTSINWNALPESVDARYLELQLFERAGAVFFEDEIAGFLGLSFTTQGNFDVYGNPIRLRAYSNYNHYQRELDNKNSVVIWNNYLRTNSVLDVRMFARRLAMFDRIMDVNVNAQKTPTLVQGTEQQRLTLMNLYKEFDGNAPVIFGDSSLDLNALKVLKTDAPFIADKLYDLKTKIWNEALTYLGISNISVEKKERLVTDEVTRSQGGTIASGNTRLKARREACEKINDMFGLNISVDFNMFSEGELLIPERDDILDQFGGDEYE